MAKLTFDSIDLSTYGLVITYSNIHALFQKVEHTQLENLAYGENAKKEPRYPKFEFAITGTSMMDLRDNLDAVKIVLVTKTARTLAIDTLVGRYFNAQLISMKGEYKSTRLFVGDMEFKCVDPLAYSTSEISHDYDLDIEDPKTIEETTGGTGYIKPIYTLTAGEALNDVTIKVECIEAGEELQWIGSLANGEELEINVATWLVRKEEVASMATVTGQFPRLLPGTDNRIKITGFGILGTLNIKYRNRFL